MEEKLEYDQYEEKQIQIHSEYWKGVSGEVMLENHRDECLCGLCMDKPSEKCYCKKCEWIKINPCEWKKECVFAKDEGENKC